MTVETLSNADLKRATLARQLLVEWSTLVAEHATLTRAERPEAEDEAQRVGQFRYPTASTRDVRLESIP